MSTPAEPTYDPYPDKPAFWADKMHWLAAAAVFATTVILTVLCFPPYTGSEFAYAFAVPALFWAYWKPGLKLFAWTLFAAQAVAWIILLWWLHYVTWLGLALLAPFVGLWVGSWYLAVWWTIPRMHARAAGMRILAMLGLAGLWVLIEWTRGWLLGGFPWLPLAASQWQRSILLQVAAYTGASGVSFILIVFNVGFAAYGERLLRSKERGLRRRSPEFMAALLVLMFPTFLLMGDAFGQKRLLFARVGIVQPYIPQSVKWDPSKVRGILEVLSTLTIRSSDTGPDLILWPESVTPYAIRGDDNLKAWTEQLVSRAGVPIVMGSNAIENRGTPQEKWFTGAFVVDPVVGLQKGAYYKRHLVPFGEYVPLRPVLGWLKKIVPIGDDDFARGTDPTPLMVSLKGGGNVVLGPLICYEDIFGNLARAQALNGAEALVVLTNNAWFGEGGGAYQHAAHSVLRAVETRRPVIRCGNGGWSGWIDEFGNVRGVMTNEDDSVYFRGTRTFNVTRDERWLSRQSYYAEHGDWFVWVCLGFVVLGLAAVTVGKPVPPPEETETAE